MIAVKGEISWMETYQSVLLERVENNESEMRKLETTAKRNLGNFTLGKKFAADIQQPQWKKKHTSETLKKCGKRNGGDLFGQHS